MKSFPAMALQLVLSLAFVIALMYGCARLLRRFNGGGRIGGIKSGRDGASRGGASRAGVRLPKLGLVRSAAAAKRVARRPDLEVVARTALGRTSSVNVVRVGERLMLLGVADGSVRLLSELDPQEFTRPEPEPVRIPLLRDGALVEDADTPSSVIELLRARTARRV